MSTDQDHTYPDIPLPPFARFELKATTDGRGWGAFATKPIKKGELIMTEFPLFIIKAPKAFAADDFLKDVFWNLTDENKELAGLARDNGGRFYNSFTAWFVQNSFSIGKTEIGFYLVQSRFNHSCQPNSAVPHTDRDNEAYLTRIALMDIKVGEEITFCYQPELVSMTRIERHDQLHFECRCQCCTLDPVASQVSDMRRTFMKALDYLSFGAFPNGKIDKSAHPLICDPFLKQAAENQSLPITTKFVYNILHVVLAQKEKVAYPSLIHALRPRIWRLANSLESESNIIIADLALKQETWVKRLGVAMLIFGQPDEADDEINDEICKMREARMDEYLGNVNS